MASDGHEVSTGSGSDRVTTRPSFIKVRLFVALPIKHVVECTHHAPRSEVGVNERPGRYRSRY
jgi:hypothetical protein